MALWCHWRRPTVLLNNPFSPLAWELGQMLGKKDAQSAYAQGWERGVGGEGEVGELTGRPERWPCGRKPGLHFLGCRYTCGSE